MSLTLVAVFLLLITGSIITFVLARKKPTLTIPVAIMIMVVESVVWFLLKGRFPLEPTVVGATSSPVSMGWSFRIDDLAWQLSLYVLLLATGVFLASEAWVRSSTAEPESNQVFNRAVPAAFLMIGLSLLSLWSNTLFSLVQSWTLLIVTWLVFLLVIVPDRDSQRKSIIRASLMMFAVLFLGLAVVSLGNLSLDDLNSAEWSQGAINWALLASITMMGLFLFHWWRPLENQLPAAVDSLAHIIPIVAGGSLLIRTVSSSNLASGYTVVLTLLCLLGLLTGVVISWMHLLHPRKLAPAVAFSAISLTVLTGIWIGPEAAAAEVRVSILAIAGIFIVSRWKSVAPIWQRIISLVFVAALAGMPLTAGLSGLLPLFATWLEQGRFILALVTSLIMVPFLAIAFYISWPRQSSTTEGSPGEIALAEIAAALTILAAGLISTDSLNLITSEIPAFALIIISTAGGLVLSRYPQRASDVQDLVRDSIRIDLPLERIKRTILMLLSSLEHFFSEGAAILEGEGGMLWIFVLLIILWLARIS
jgi:hypothetical protein